MRVLRLTPHFYYTKEVVGSWDVRMDQVGGMQTQLYRQSLAMSEMGVSQLVYPIGMPSAPKRWVINDNLVVEKSNLPLLPFRSKERGTVGLYSAWFLGVIKKLITSRHADYDVIHVHSCAMLSNLLIGIIAKKICKAPIVYTIHRSRVATFIPSTLIEKLTNKLIIQIEGWCVRNSDKVVVLNTNAKNSIVRGHGVSEDKVVVIPDAIDFDEFAGKASESACSIFRERYSLPAGRKIITFVGRMNSEKGCATLIKAYAQLLQKDTFLMLCGDGNERDALENLVKSLGISDRVCFTGYITNDEVASAISISDVIVMPSKYEEFGGIILEVAAIGKPLVASKVGGIPLVVKDRISGLLCDPQSSDEFAEQIDRVLRDDTYAHELGQALKLDLTNGFSMQKQVGKIVEVYDSLRSISVN